MSRGSRRCATQFTSKWNKIEHRLFSFITINWRGKPLRSYLTIVQLIAATTTDTGSKFVPNWMKTNILKASKFPMLKWPWLISLGTTQSRHPVQMRRRQAKTNAHDPLRLISKSPTARNGQSRELVPTTKPYQAVQRRHVAAPQAEARPATHPESARRAMRWLGTRPR